MFAPVAEHAGMAAVFLHCPPGYILYTGVIALIPVWPSPTTPQINTFRSHQCIHARPTFPFPSQPNPHRQTRLIFPSRNLSADTGAGIGRITTSLLAPLSTSVDVIEPITKFTDQLRAEHPALFTSSPPTISRIINTGLESWHPEPNRHYDLVWNQWCLGHLTDAALIAYLRRLRPALSPRGWVVVKENVTGDGKRRRFVAPISNASEDTTTSELGGHDDDIAHEIPLQLGDEDQYDDEDSSVTRSAGKFEYCFAQAGWRVVRTEVQRGFGKELGLFPVRMWGLQPLEEGGDDGDV
ncbi:uncharacterized protein HMPREF1541_06663 [Cyphellophora europaea CBS 101466]|uniref:Alpha N-terminal protein methyltransferase 1 n=1 Tax=Cyphellophora europaea (strain CBS 101466) TaxID=1220924 RepID=W2RQ21_CYPE1|nr:uncharacterized protein HMPREF1541_06663 [Cyphellophora europaea CBS 101466]ETN38626.1 hypothetical protein HMPREF1541_06663 [Cyphellophora europaea CBS 101466]